MQYFAYSQKSFVYKYVVMLCDIDQFKHMSFANYLKLMFLATDALFVSCYSEDFLSKQRLRMNYSKMQLKKQTVCGDNILIKVNSSEVEESQFSLLFTFVIEGTGELVGLGKQTYASLGLADEKPKVTSQSFKDVLIPIRVDEKHMMYKY